MRVTASCTALSVVLAVLASACLDRDPVPPGPPGAVTSGMGPGLSIPQAIASDIDGPLLVNGFVVARGGDMRLCEMLAESYPPQCAGRSLRVTGLDLSGLPGVNTAGGVSWTGEAVQLLGTVKDGSLRIEARSRA